MLSSSKARNPLDLNGADFSALMKDVVRLLAEFLDHLPNAPGIPDRGNNAFTGSCFFERIANPANGAEHSYAAFAIKFPQRVQVVC